jgi:glucose-6-phosphate 1-dehydrogenase
MIYTSENLNPLKDLISSSSPNPCILVIFGATGDLTAKKLIPALYNLAREGLLPSRFVCVGFARRPKDHDLFRKEMFEAISSHSRTKPIEAHTWATFSQQLFYHQSEFDSDTGYENLALTLKKFDSQFGTKQNRVYYLSTPPSYFPIIAAKLKEHNLLYPSTEENRFSRIIIEKPFGHDSTSAHILQNNLQEQGLHESQVYRIDHYLGKETVQNLLVLRFANALFESVWNNKFIDHVQITVSEDFGVGTRGRFFEEAGALRDIMQNHMMQLLSLVAMEPPVTLSADSIRDEKVKVLQSVRPLKADDVQSSHVRGQYGPGFIKGTPVVGYRQEENVNPQSHVETYVALKLFIDNWRWAGVPFFLRSGKRLPKRATEIAIVFKEAPGALFNIHSQNDSNVLVIRIQPDEGVALKFNSKIPGNNTLIHPVKMDFKCGSYYGATPPEAYERLLWDAMLGDSTLFARQDEVIASWQIIEPILDCWKESPPSDFPNYPSGSWGPQAAEELIQKTGRQWRLI